jgi:WG containing repeat
MKCSPNIYLILALCFFSFPASSLAQDIKKNENTPRCCYPIISEVNSKVGFIDETGRLVVPPAFPNVGFMDETGRLVNAATFPFNVPSIEFVPSAYRADPFSEGLAPAQVKASEPDAESKWGFINRRGQMTIAPTFTEARNFSEGLAAVEVTLGNQEEEGKWGFINKKGQMVIAPFYSGALDFSEGLAPVRIAVSTGPEAESKWGFINQKGEMIISPAYSSALNFSDGLAAVSVTVGTGQETKAEWGFIDHKGQMVIAPTYPAAPAFSEGLASVQLTNNRLGFIDKKGDLVVTTNFQFASLTDTFIASSFKKDQFDDSPYEDQEFGEPPRFSEGLYPVRVKGKWGYIDKQGEILISPRFDVAGNFHEGVASVGVGRRAGFINKQGRYVIPLRFRYAGDFSNGLALVFFRHSYRNIGSRVEETRRHTIFYGYINKKGQAVFRGKNVFITEIQGGDLQEVIDFPPEVEVLIKSSPDKAKIYLVPFSVWDLDESILNDEKRLSEYLFPEATVYEGKVNQQVYMVVLEYQGKKIARKLDAHDKKVNKVDVAFDK